MSAIQIESGGNISAATLKPKTSVISKEKIRKIKPGFYDLPPIDEMELHLGNGLRRFALTDLDKIRESERKVDEGEKQTVSSAQLKTARLEFYEKDLTKLMKRMVIACKQLNPGSNIDEDYIRDQIVNLLYRGDLRYLPPNLVPNQSIDPEGKIDAISHYNNEFSRSNEEASFERVIQAFLPQIEGLWTQREESATSIGAGRRKMVAATTVIGGILGRKVPEQVTTSVETREKQKEAVREAQLNTSRLLFFQLDLPYLLNSMVQAYKLQKPDCTEDDKDIKSRIVDSLYEGTIRELPPNLIPNNFIVEDDKGNANSYYETTYSRSREEAAYNRLIIGYAPKIKELWENRERKAGELGAVGRQFIAVNMTFQMMYGIQKPAQVYKALGYSQKEIASFLHTRIRSIPLNTLLMVFQDFGTTGLAYGLEYVIGMASSIQQHPEITYPVAAFTALAYYAEMIKYLEDIRVHNEKDPDLVPSVAAYLASPLERTLFAEHEIGSKQAVNAAAFYTNLYEAWREGSWNIATTKLHSVIARIAGDASAAFSLRTQRKKILPQLSSSKKFVDTTSYQLTDDSEVDENKSHKGIKSKIKGILYRHSPKLNEVPIADNTV